MTETAKEKLIANIAASLSKVSREDIIERSIGHFRKANPEYGDQVAKAVAKQRDCDKRCERYDSLNQPERPGR